MIEIYGPQWYDGPSGWLPPKIPNQVMDILLTQSAPVVVNTDIKADLKIDGSDDDAYITDLINLCQAHCEEYCGASFGERTVQAVVCNAEGCIELPYGPVQAITAITDFDGNDLTADVITSGISFLRLVAPMCKYINITYTAGYNSLNLPADIKKAVRMEVGYRYRFRGLEAPERGIVNPGLCPEAIIYLKPFKRNRFM